MENKEENDIESQSISRQILQEQLRPLLETTGIIPRPPPPPPPPPQQQQKTPAKKAIRKTFKGTAHLAKLLPTGSVLTFQILSPIFTHQGQCYTKISRTLTSILLILCSFSCFFLCFTDSFRDERGKVRYGLATFRGLWVIDGSISLSPENGRKYGLRFIDFFHGLMSILVFGAVVLFDQNVVTCFYPTPSDEAKELLMALPVGVGVVCSILFVIFPTKRHGIGFPLSRQ